MNHNITDAELEVMRILWRENRPVSFSELRELETTKGWKKSTVQTLMLRLRDKGVIERDGDYEPARYVPAISEREYSLSESESLLGRLFDGSAAKLVAALSNSGRLSESDAAEMRRFFKVEPESPQRGGGWS